MWLGGGGGGQQNYRISHEKRDIRLEAIKFLKDKDESERKKKGKKSYMKLPLLLHGSQAEIYSPMYVFTKHNYKPKEMCNDKTVYIPQLSLIICVEMKLRA